MKTIEDERAQRMRSFNDYRAHFGLRRMRSFDDFNTSPEVSAALAALYPTVDDVDFVVGIMVEQIYEEGASAFSEAMTQMVGAFALSAILNFVHVRDPALSSVERLSQAGVDYLRNASLRALLSKHAGLEEQLPCGTPLLVPEAPSASLCPSDFIDKPTGWAFHNIFDFVTIDEVADSFFTDDYFGNVFMVQLACFLIIFALFFTVNTLFVVFQRGFRKLEVFERYRRVFGVSNIIVLVTGLVPYTYYILRSLFGPDLLETIQDDYIWIFGFFLLHGCIYVIEVCSRLIFFNTGWMLLFHHTLWVVLILVAAATRSVFMVKVDLILDGFVNYEVGLFVATFLRRTGISLVWRKRSIVWGCALFAVTRVLQLLVLFYLFIGSATRMVRCLYLPVGQRASPSSPTHAEDSTHKLTPIGPHSPPAHTHARNLRCTMGNRRTSVSSCLR
jgi:hypothetical protein